MYSVLLVLCMHACVDMNLRPWRLGAARRSEGELRHEHGLRDAALLRGCEQVVVREGI